MRESGSDAWRMLALVPGEDAEARATFVQRLAGAEPALILVFAEERTDLTALCADLQARAPGARVAGCTTMGEVGPEGLTRRGAVGWAFGAPSRAGAVLVEGADGAPYVDGLAVIGELCAQLGVDRLDPTRHLLIVLSEGLTGLAEILVAALATSAPEIPLVGGAAGDGEQYIETFVRLGARETSQGTVVIALEPGVEFVAFQAHHFLPTERRMVVTGASADRRLLHELDGRPAVTAACEAFGVDEAALRARPHATMGRVPLAFGIRVGDDFFLRSVMTVQGDSLLMGGALENGTVLRVMRGVDLVPRTLAGLNQAFSRLRSPPRGMLVFNCGGRMWEVAAQGKLPEFAASWPDIPSIGFTTYGEYFGPLLVNQTLAGVLFGSRP